MIILSEAILLEETMVSNIENDKRILVVAPHPDDESIGCGGLLIKYGQQCDVLLITDGRKGYASCDKVDEDKLAAEREAELKKSCEIANVKNVFCLKIHDGEGPKNKKTIREFDIKGYDFIFVPNHNERQIDHSYLLGVFKKMRNRQKKSIKIFEYEVWSPLASPTDVLNISDIIKKKEKMVSQFVTQIKYVDYVALTLSLNRYRGASYKTQYAETYRYVPYLGFLKSIYRKIPGKWKAVFKSIT